MSVCSGRRGTKPYDEYLDTEYLDTEFLDHIYSEMMKQASIPRSYFTWKPKGFPIITPEIFFE